MDVEVLADHLRFPEGPTFDAEGRLWFVEIEGGCLTVLLEGVPTRFEVGGRPNGMAFDASGTAWYCDQLRGLRTFDSQVGPSTVAEVYEGRPLQRPNDLAFDAAGNLVFTCPGDSRVNPTGELFCLSPDRTLSRLAGDLLFPNGLAFSPDGRELIVAETYGQRLLRGEWDPEDRLWVTPRQWAKLPGRPDGITFAPDGTLFVALFGSGLVASVDPEGIVRQTVATPGSRPTNCVLDLTSCSDLFVTEAERGELLLYRGLGRCAGRES